MKCFRCQSELPDNSNFCLICGLKMGNKTPLSDANGVESSMGCDVPRTIAGIPTKISPALPNLPEAPDYGTKDDLEAASDGFRKRFAIIKEIGRGGMGIVYVARDKKLDRMVAIKQLSVKHEADRSIVDRFLREARSIAALNHQNIVAVYDISQTKEGPHIVMEYVSGGDLSAFISQKGKMTVKDAVRFARPIGLGLSYAHKRGVIHRDIKPRNILLTEDRIPKIADFGLARIGRSSELSVSGFGMGTEDYAPPEQKRDAKSVDHRADIYSFGAMLYEMVTGDKPSVVRESAIPIGLRDLILKCMATRPEDRYFSVYEVLIDLDKGTSSGETIIAPGIAKGVGSCPSCGYPNPEDAKYCLGCGAGLFEKCPKCGREARLGLRFCGGCGIDLGKYKQYVSSVRAGKDFYNQHEYGRAVKELTVARDLFQLDEESDSMLKDASARKAQCDQLKKLFDNAIEKRLFEDAKRASAAIKDIKPAQAVVDEMSDILRKTRLAAGAETVAEAIKNNKWEDAEKELKNITEIIGESKEVNILRQKVVGAKFIAALKSAEACITAYQFADAEKYLFEAQQLRPNDERCKVQANRLLTVQFDFASDTASKALQKGNYDLSERYLADARKLQPNHPSIQKLETAIAEARFVQHLEQAIACIAAGRFDDADKCVAEAKRLKPDDERAMHAANKALTARFDSALEQVYKNIQNGNFKEAERHLAEARNLQPASENVGQAGRAISNGRCEAAERLISSAAEMRAKRKYTEARLLLTESLGIDRENRNALNMQREIKWEVLIRKIKQVITGIAACLLVALAIVAYFFISQQIISSSASAAIAQAEKARENADGVQFAVDETHNDYSLAESNLADAKYDLEKNDFAAALQKANTAADNFARVCATRAQLKQQKDDAEAAMAAAEDARARAQKEEKGDGASEMSFGRGEKLLTQSTAKLKQKNYVSAKDDAENAAKAFGVALDGRLAHKFDADNIDKIIADAKNLKSKIGNMEVGPKGADENYKNADKALQGCVNVAMKDEPLEERQRYQALAEETRQGFQTMLMSHENLATEYREATSEKEAAKKKESEVIGKAYGINATKPQYEEAHALLVDVEKDLQNKNRQNGYADVAEKARKAAGMFDGIAKIRDEFQSKHDKAQSAIAEAEAKKKEASAFVGLADVLDQKYKKFCDLLETSNKKQGEENFDDALKIAAEAQDGFDKYMITAQAKREADAAVKDALTAKTEANQERFPGAPEDLFNEANTALEKAKADLASNEPEMYEAARQNTHQAALLFKEVSSNWQKLNPKRKTANDAISSAKTASDKADGLDFPITGSQAYKEASEKLQTARDAFAIGSYDDAADMAKQSKTLYEKVIAQIENIKPLFKRVETVKEQADAQTIGITETKNDYDSACNLFQEAEQAFKEGLLSEAESKANMSTTAFDSVTRKRNEAEVASRIIKAHGKAIWCIAISPDGKWIATAGRDGIAKIWSVQTRKEVSALKGHDDEVRAVAFSPDSKTLATGGEDKTIKLWDVQSGRLFKTLLGHDDDVAALAFTPDGKFLISGSWDDTLMLWEASTGRQKATFTGHTKNVHCIDISPDGEHVVSGSEDKTVIMWEISTQRALWTYLGQKGDIDSVKFTADGRFVASGSWDDSIDLLNAETGKLIRKFSGHKNNIRGVAFSNSGNLLATASKDKTVKLWNVRTGTETTVFEGHEAEVLSVIFSRDDKWIISVDGRGVMRFWKVSE